MLISLVQAPGQFRSEGGKEGVFAKTNQVQAKLFFSHCQLDTLIYDLSACIQCANEKLGPALNFKGNYIGIGNNYRSNIQVVGRYRRYHKSG